MSLCHPKQGKASCGACCGILNLKLSKEEFVFLLQERTKQFKETVDFSQRNSFPIYRQSRETKEKDIPKLDVQTYNCPFLGYVGETLDRIGCMIHPIYTGDPKSQNFSFYGASICQAYDCKTKESSLEDLWSHFFSSISIDSIEYSKFAADHIFTQNVLQFFQFFQVSASEMFLDYTEILKRIFLARANSGKTTNLTSFEINFESKKNKESLMEYFQVELGEDWNFVLVDLEKKSPEKFSRGCLLD